MNTPLFFFLAQQAGNLAIGQILGRILGVVIGLMVLGALIKLFMAHVRQDQGEIRAALRVLGGLVVVLIAYVVIISVVTGMWGAEVVPEPSFEDFE